MREFFIGDFQAKKIAEGWHTGIEAFIHGRREREISFLYRPEDRSTRIVHGLSGLPAVKITDLSSGIVIREEWRINRMHREVGPALVIRDVHTGIVIRQDWFLHGRHHRDGGPAIVRYDHVTGDAIYEAFCERGKVTRECLYPENDIHPTPRQISRRERLGHQISLETKFAPD